MQTNFKTKSMRSGNIYELKIFKEKYKEEWRICNITKGHICPCIFKTLDEAISDVYKFQSEGKIEILPNNLKTKRSECNFIDEASGMTPQEIEEAINDN